LIIGASQVSKPVILQKFKENAALQRIVTLDRYSVLNANAFIGALKTPAAALYLFFVLGIWS